MIFKAIQTKYLPCTDLTGSRVSASDSDGNRVIVPFNSDFSAEDSHIRAAQALCKKMDWHGKLVMGGTKEGKVFVFAESVYDRNNTIKAHSFKV